jgi:hypothetical protein
MIMGERLEARGERLETSGERLEARGGRQKRIVLVASLDNRM